MVFFRELRHLLECMKVFIVSKIEREICEFEMDLTNFFVCGRGRGGKVCMCLQLWCSLNRLFRKIWGGKRAFPCTFSPTECGILKTRPSIMNSENSFYAYLFVSNEFFFYG